MIEIHDLEELDRTAATGSLENVVVQGLDLSSRTSMLRSLPVAGTVFLGCTIAPEAIVRLTEGGALLFPRLPNVPYDPYRAKLYSVPELYDGFDPLDPDSYPRSLDARVYAHAQAAGGAHPVSILETLAQRLHDHAITDALEELLDGQKVVAVMGGHSMQRGAPDYAKVAEIGRALGERGFLIATGGGPGAMEAALLGARFAGSGRTDLDEAIAMLAAAPHYRDRGFLTQAFAVRSRFPREGGISLGVPTWHYGHEPPNVFATHIAKYFANSVREEGLLAIAEHGVVFAPGSAGTIQEIFQDACQNHYLTSGGASPMIFLGEIYWRETKPVYPLLARLAEGQAYARHLAITDDPEEAVARIVAFEPGL